MAGTGLAFALTVELASLGAAFFLKFFPAGGGTTALAAGFAVFAEMPATARFFSGAGLGTAWAFVFAGAALTGRAFAGTVLTVLAVLGEAANEAVFPVMTMARMRMHAETSFFMINNLWEWYGRFLMPL
ncbi:MAG: hypothetical protein IK027_03055 [Deltaproteobacteria bacterium]|nr:hypothetical protein [Deltaproteobacteria bacterium]